MSKLKEFWEGSLSLITFIIGIMLYLFLSKNKKQDNSNTVEASNELDKSIREAEAVKDRLQQEQNSLESSISELENKRIDSKNKMEEMTNPKAIEDYWNT